MGCAREEFIFTYGRGQREETEGKRQWRGQTGSARTGWQGELRVPEKEVFRDWLPCLWRMGVRDERGFQRCAKLLVSLPPHPQVMSIFSREIIKLVTSKPLKQWLV